MAVALLALWLIGGVEPLDALRYAGYEAAFTIGPGWLLLRAIAPGVRSPGWQLALGWPLGLVCEIALFALTAALGARDLFVIYPLLIGLPCAAVLFARSRGERSVEPAAADAPRVGLGPRERWAVAALCLVALGYLGLTLVALTPLPGSVPSVFYPSDAIFHIALVGEALHHWPLQGPLVSGESLHYHYFFHLHAAAAAQVTGIEPALLVTRLCLPPLVLLLVAQLALAGRAVSGVAWAGPIAAGLGLLAWELDLSIPEIAPFLGVNDIWLWASPTYVLGLVFLVPLSALIAGLAERRVLRRITGARGRRAALVLVALLVAGGAGAKVVTIPVLAGGLAIFLAWCHLRGTPPPDRTLAGVLGLCVGVFALLAAALYLGGGGSELSLDPGGIYERMPSLILLERDVGGGFVAEALFWAVGGALTTLLHFGPVLAGLYWVLGRGRPPLRPGQALLLCVLVAGLPAWFLLSSDNADNAYFTAFGIAAALPVAAEGLCRALALLRRRAERAPEETGARGAPWTALVVGAWVALMLSLAWGAWELTLDGRPAQGYALAYLGLALGLGAVALWARGGATPRRAGLALPLALAALLAAGLDLMLDTAPVSARNLADGLPLYSEGVGGHGITPASVEVAEWIREQTDEDAVLAVSDQRSPQGAALAPLRAELPALAERRSFYEGWAYARGELPFGEVVARESIPHPERMRLEQRAFVEGDRAALERMRDAYGVTHVVVDLRHGPVAREVYSAGRVVFANDRVEVIELD